MKERILSIQSAVPKNRRQFPYFLLPDNQNPYHTKKNVKRRILLLVSRCKKHLKYQEHVRNPRCTKQSVFFLTLSKGERGGSMLHVLYKRRHHYKSVVFFRAFTKLAIPPPPNSGNSVIFFRTSIMTFCAYDRINYLYDNGS